MKSLASAMLAGVLILGQSVISSAAPAQPDVGDLRAAILLDGATGQVLYQLNAENTNFPASTTKLLAALVVAEREPNLDRTVTVSANAAAPRVHDESSCYVYDGEQQKIRYLMYGLLLASGNDCAVALAEGVAGNEDAFVALMNETAKRAGAVNSNFMNPHGLHHDQHYTTAYDLGMIALAALKNPVVADMASTFSFIWPDKLNAAGVPIDGPYYNHNKLLEEYADGYPGARGGKTGYTEEAGLTLVASAERDGMFLVGVILGAENQLHQYRSMESLLDFGFANFEHRHIVSAGSGQGEVAVVDGLEQTLRAAASESFSVAVPKTGPTDITLVPRLAPTIEAPIAANQTIGTLEVRQGQRILHQIDLVAMSAVEAAPPPGLRWASLSSAGRVAKTVGLWVLYLFLGLFAFRVVVLTIRRVLRHRRRMRGSMGDGRRHTIRYYRSQGD